MKEISQSSELQKFWDPYIPMLLTKDQLYQRLNGKFWKSPDIHLATDTLAPAGSIQYAQVWLPPGLDVFHNLHTGAFSSLRGSTRSRFAQMGIEVRNPGSGIAESLEKLKYDKDAPAQIANVPVINHSENGIFIPKETGLFRLFLPDWQNPVEGEKLETLVKQGLIKISGLPGVEWNYATYPQDKSTANGIIFKLNSQNPVAPKKIGIISVKGNSGIDYRRQIDQLLKPIEPNSQRSFWVGETKSRVTLDPTVNGVIEEHTWRHGEDFSQPQSPVLESGWHIQSHLIDGGFSWNIRTEILSTVGNLNNMPDSIIIRFYKSGPIIHKARR